MRTQIQESASELRIGIPGARLSVAAGLGLAVPLCVLFFVFFLAPDLVRFFERTRTPGVVQMVFLGFLALVCLVLPSLHALNAIRRAVRGQTLVAITPGGIVIEIRDAWRTRAFATRS